MATPKEIEQAHNEGQRVENEGDLPTDALARAFVYDREEKEAFEKGRENVREQREGDRS
jgi:hypothetical protein